MVTFPNYSTLVSVPELGGIGDNAATGSSDARYEPGT
jgi:hypothetical protein